MCKKCLAEACMTFTDTWFVNFVGIPRVWLANRDFPQAGRLYFMVSIYRLGA